MPPAIKLVKLEKGMFQEKDTNGYAVPFSQILEREDPSENYTGNLAKLDAYQRQLAARGLVVSGPRSVKLEMFNSDPDNRLLFVEFIDRNILIPKDALKNHVALTDIVATRQGYPSRSFQALSYDITGDADLDMADVNEAAQFPTVKITLGEKSYTMRKRGLRILDTYEYRREVTVAQYALLLRRIGVQLEKSKVALALEVAINGLTGNSDAAPVDDIDDAEIGGSAGTLTYTDLVKWDAVKWDDYDALLWIAEPTTCGDILTMDEFMAPKSKASFNDTGEWPNPLGKKLKKSTSTLLADKVLGIDPNFCLEEVYQEGADITEIDKIINGQWNELVMSKTFGFRKLFKNSARLLDIDPS